MDERDEVMEVEEMEDDCVEVEVPSGAPGWLLFALGGATALVVKAGVKKAREIYKAHKEGKKVEFVDIDEEDIVEVNVNDDESKKEE